MLLDLHRLWLARRSSLLTPPLELASCPSRIRDSLSDPLALCEVFRPLNWDQCNGVSLQMALIDGGVLGAWYCLLALYPPAESGLTGSRYPWLWWRGWESCRVPGACLNTQALGKWREALLAAGRKKYASPDSSLCLTLTHFHWFFSPFVVPLCCAASSRSH